jgi:hypothetical protein
LPISARNSDDKAIDRVPCYNELKAIGTSLAADRSMIEQIDAFFVRLPTPTPIVYRDMR